MFILEETSTKIYFEHHLIQTALFLCFLNEKNCDQHGSKKNMGNQNCSEKTVGGKRDKKVSMLKTDKTVWKLKKS